MERPDSIDFSYLLVARKSAVLTANEKHYEIETPMEGPITEVFDMTENLQEEARQMREIITIE